MPRNYALRGRIDKNALGLRLSEKCNALDFGLSDNNQNGLSIPADSPLLFQLINRFDDPVEEPAFSPDELLDPFRTLPREGNYHRGARGRGSRLRRGFNCW